MAELLLNKGAKINEKNTDVLPVLDLMDKSDKKDTSELLRSRMTDKKTSDGFTPLMVAVIAASDRWTGAVYDRHKEMIEFLVKKGADIKTGFYGLTPLHMAVWAGNKELAEFFFSKGADVNGRDSKGCTPLHIAALRGERSLAEFLISKGADIKARDNDGNTPLNLAVIKEIKDFLNKEEINK